MLKNKKVAIIYSILVYVFVMFSTTYPKAMASEIPKTFEQNNTTQVRLQDDFYQAVNAEWLNNAKLKTEEDERSVFTDIKSKVNDEMKSIFEELLLHQDKYNVNSDEKKIINFYNNIFNIEARNEQGIKPIEQYINKIKNVQNLEELTKLFSDPEINIFNNLIQFGVEPDYKDNKNYALYIYSTPLFLGDSDQYTKESETSKENKTRMEKYLNDILILSGYSQDQAKEKINNLFQFENMLAPSILGVNEFYQDSNKSKDMYKAYNVQEVSNIAPNLNLLSIMKGLGYDKANKVILFEPKWLEKLNELYTEENLPIIKDYIEICMISSMSKYLSQDFKSKYSEFQKSLYDIKEDKSLKKEADELINKNFGTVLSRLYVNRYFTDDAKRDVEEITKEIIDNYKKRINNLEWMSNSTKNSAIKKLNCLKANIGYPDDWKDYSKLEIKSYKEGGSLANNIINLELFSYKEALNKLNKSVDKLELPFNLGLPEDVNAYYDPNTNEITVPAAILQAPFYDSNASKEVNLGGIGSIIGHEITHAFDNNGSKYDENGDIKNWWTDADYKKYEDKIEKIADFYGNIETRSGQKVDGKLTLAENIADIGSMTCMLDILNSMPNADYDAFFKNFATIWRDVTTKEYDELLLKVDSHSPSNIRVNSVVKQFGKFYETYNVTEKDGMYIKLEDRLSIW